MNKMYLAFGTLCLIGAAVIASNASNYRYHVYRTTIENAERFPSRIRPTSSRLQNPDYNRTRQYGRFVPTDMYPNQGTFNAETNGDDARRENTKPSNRIVIRNGQYKYYKTINYTGTTPKSGSYLFDEDKYSMAPFPFVKRSGENYTSNRSSLAFRVVDYSAKICTTGRFVICATQGRNAFLSQNNVTREDKNEAFNKQGFAWRQTQLNHFTYYPTYTESFYGKYQGKDRVYYVFSALNPETNQVIRIEGVGRPEDQARTAQDFYRVMQAFRFNN